MLQLRKDINDRSEPTVQYYILETMKLETDKKELY